MKSNKSITFLLVLGLFFSAGCESSLMPSMEDGDKDAQQTVLSSSENGGVNANELAGKLRAGANTVKRAIQDSDFRNELYNLLEFYSEQDNRFDAVSFAEVESNKALHRNDRAYQSNIPMNKARNVLKEAFRKAESNSQSNNKSLRKFLIKDLANLDMPNLSEWDGEEIPTVTWHPLSEEEASNTGFEPRVDSENPSKVTGWKKVTVDEKYGEEHPVLIVLPGESGAEYSYTPDDMEVNMDSWDDVELNYVEEPCETETCFEDPGGGGGGGDDGGDDDETIRTDETSMTTDAYPPEDTESMEVQLGWVRLNTYPCGWFCPGREVRFGHQLAYQSLEDSPITVESIPIKAYIKDDERGTWQKKYIQWDTNWDSYQMSKQLVIWVARDGGHLDDFLQGVYEVSKVALSDDPQPEDYIDPIYETALRVNQENIQRDVFYDGVLDRGTFISNNSTAAGWGLKDGDRVYHVENSDGGSIDYTLRIVE